jgi:hypothetical protein
LQKGRRVPASIINNVINLFRSHPETGGGHIVVDLSRPLV